MDGRRLSCFAAAVRPHTRYVVCRAHTMETFEAELRRLDAVDPAKAATTLVLLPGDEFAAFADLMVLQPDVQELADELGADVQVLPFHPLATYSAAGEDEEVEDDEGEDIEAMSIEQLQELMEEIGGPRVEEMSLAEARESAWQFIEENFGAEHDHDDDHEEEEDDGIAYVGGGKYTENVSELDDMGLEELVALMDDVGGPSVEGMSLADAQDAAWQFLEENFSDVCEGE